MRSLIIGCQDIVNASHACKVPRVKLSKSTGECLAIAPPPPSLKTYFPPILSCIVFFFLGGGGCNYSTLQPVLWSGLSSLHCALLHKLVNVQSPAITCDFVQSHAGKISDGTLETALNAGCSMKVTALDLANSPGMQFPTALLSAKYIPDIYKAPIAPRQFERQCNNQSRQG